VKGGAQSVARHEWLLPRLREHALNRGGLPRSSSIFCRPVPNANWPIRNFIATTPVDRGRGVQCRR
jgi:hypothetical protein